VKLLAKKLHFQKVGLKQVKRGDSVTFLKRGKKACCEQMKLGVFTQKTAFKASRG